MRKASERCSMFVVRVSTCFGGLVCVGFRGVECEEIISVIMDICASVVRGMRVREYERRKSESDRHDILIRDGTRSTLKPERPCTLQASDPGKTCDTAVLLLSFSFPLVSPRFPSFPILRFLPFLSFSTHRFLPFPPFPFLRPSLLLAPCTLSRSLDASP